MMLEPVSYLFSENINLYFQSSGNRFFDLLFLALSTIFSEPGYMLLASIIFWCFDKKTGIRLMYVTIFSSFAAAFAKSFFGLPRPPEYLHKTTANGFGFPSGHATASSCFWGYFGGRVKNRHIIITGIAAILAVSLSRVYLGVHYAGDVIGGILFGLAIALFSMKAEPVFLNKWKRLERISKYFIVLVFPAILMAIAIVQGGSIGEQFERGLVMAGIGTGYLLEEDRIRFAEARNNKQKFNRFILGLLILAIVYLTSVLVFPDRIIFIYAALGLGSTYIVPRAFTWMESRSNTEALKKNRS